MEEWRSVVGWEGSYEVSSLGRVRSLSRVHRTVIKGTLTYRTVSGRVLAASKDKYGRPKVCLFKENKRYYTRVACLVAAAFISERPQGLQVRHWDGDNSRNIPGNLLYGTSAENAQDKIRHGRSKVNKGESNGNHVLTALQVVSIRQTYKLRSVSYLAALYGVSETTITRVGNYEAWKHIS